MFRGARNISIRSFIVIAAVGAGLFGAMAWSRAQDAKPSHSTWSTYLGSPDSSHYIALTQINRSNVDKLEVAWSYDSGNERAYEFNPIVVGNVMYVIAQHSDIVALDAATGKPIWIHHPNSMGQRLEVHRGINYWQSQDGKEKRLFIPFDNHLEAIDAATGELIKSFGDGGSVDLKVGLGRDPKSMYQIQAGTPGQVFENLIIVGSETGEDYGSPPGDIRAYDVRSGRMVWIFHTIPHPGEFGYDTWPAGSWKTAGGTNCWGEMSLDEKTGIVYIPTGAPTYDFYGADRKGNTLFADSLLALDARTGKLIWYYQFIHHDLWDYDATSAPQLLTIKHDGQDVDVVAEASKQGYLYVFNRATGKPIWPIEERPAPKSSMPGEAASPTQPVPTAPPPFARQKFTVADLDPYILSPRDRARWKAVVEGAINEGLFTPPEQQDTVEMPGNRGGSNWGMTASNPDSGAMFVVSMDLPAILKDERRAPPSLWNIPTSGTPPQQGKAVYHFYCERCHGADHEGAPPAIPSLVNAPANFGADTIKSVVKYGLKDMPGFPDLTDRLLDGLISYLGNPESAPGPLPPGGEPPAGAHSAGESTVRYWTGYGLQPAIIKPPWSVITAYDLNRGTIKWQVPLGDAPQGAREHLKDTGVMLPRNGPVVTASGLYFIATKDEGKLRAYDQKTGKVLWSVNLPAASEGVPAVYEVDGREYIVVCATSAKQTDVPRDGPEQPTAEPVHRSYIAYALPKNLVGQK
ncbi:MAG: pyrroloquinoline quinone-dependent dehydrogenase [Candidatus Acidiferrales bacterium]